MQPVLRKGKLALRPTEVGDCDYVTALESRPENAPHVDSWSRARHEAHLDDPAWAHWIVEQAGTPVGFVILQDADDADGNLLLRRIVIEGKGRGLGRNTMLLVMHYCFDILGFHRFWLYVGLRNRRAYNFYRRLGFQQEGIARECSREGDSHVSMYILSILEQEYREKMTENKAGKRPVSGP